MCESADLPAGPPPPYQDMEGHEDSPLTDDMLVRYQYIALAPTFATNFRFVLYNDGRLFYAHNSTEPNDPIYNTPLPDTPNRTLPQAELNDIIDTLKAADFFAQPRLVAVKARGGALMIVTARLDNAVHEVWYENGNNELLDLLHNLSAEEPAETTIEDQRNFWDSLWEES